MACSGQRRAREIFRRSHRHLSCMLRVPRISILFEAYLMISITVKSIFH
jgi:hypothetical protein